MGLPHRFRRSVLALATGLFLGAAEARPAAPGPEAAAGVGLLDAVRVTLALDPAIKLQEQALESARGGVMVAQGQFNPVPSAEIRYQHNTTPLLRNQRTVGLVSLVGDTLATQIAMDQQFRTGVRITPSVGMTRTEDNGSNATVPHVATVNLNITIPLLKGLGERAVAANERAAEFEQQAAMLDLWHQISMSMAKTAQAYWNYRAATLALEAYREAQSRLEELLDNGRKLVEADEVPPADLKQYESQLATASANRIGAEQTLVEARQGLGLAMGLPFERIAALPPPADDFPPTDGPPLADAARTAQLIEAGLVRRNDLKAAEQRLEGAESLLAAAQNGILPQVDLSLDVGYQGLAEGGQASNFFFQGLGRNVEGVNAGASLRYRWPVYNQTAQGNLARTQANLRGIAIDKENLARNIRSDILVAASNLDNTLAQFRQAKAATESIRAAFENEKKKQKLEMSTAIDVLLIQTQLTDATVNQITIQGNYAAALAQLRFATATLFVPDQESQDIGLEQLTTAPNPAKP